MSILYSKSSTDFYSEIKKTSLGYLIPPSLLQANFFLLLSWAILVFMIILENARPDFPLKIPCGYYSHCLKYSRPQIYGSLANSLSPGLYSIVTCPLFLKKLPSPAQHTRYPASLGFFFPLSNHHSLTHYIMLVIYVIYCLSPSIKM